MELGGALAHFVAWVMSWVIRLGAAAATIWFGVTVLKVIMKGGRGREVWELVAGLAAVVILYAMLQDYQGTMAMLGGLGQQAWGGIKAELAAGLS